MRSVLKELDRRIKRGVRLTLRFKLGEMTVDEERPKMLPTIA